MKLSERCELPFDICEECEKADFNIEKNTLFAENVCVLNEIIVTCSNEKICENLMNMIDKANK